MWETFSRALNIILLGKRGQTLSARVGYNATMHGGIWVLYERHLNCFAYRMWQDEDHCWSIYVRELKRDLHKTK